MASTRKCQHYDGGASVCGKSLYRKNKTGFCAKHSQQHQSVERTKLPPPPPEGLVITGDTAELTKRVDRQVRSLDDLISACDIDTTTWHILTYECRKWAVAMKPHELAPPEAPPIVTDLFMVKAKMVRKVEVLNARKEIEALIEDAKTRLAAPPIVLRKKAAGAHMLEISIPDLHIGKLAWHPETGHGDYDTKIAQELFKTALETLVQRTSSYSFEKVLFVVGNDLLHSDTKQGTTTKGTPLDTDSRYHKTFLAARRMITRAVDRLRLVAPVDVVVVPGNHDTLSAWQLGDSLACYFHSTPDVNVINNPNPRTYVQFGKVMLLLTHGDKGKKQNLPLLMAHEEPEMWAATVHREAHTGHLHQLRVQEFHGVRVRISPALCAPDSWHSENAFVGHARAAEAFVWHKDEGLICQATYTVPPVARFVEAA